MIGTEVLKADAPNLRLFRNVESMSGRTVGNRGFICHHRSKDFFECVNG